MATSLDRAVTVCQDLERAEAEVARLRRARARAWVAAHRDHSAPVIARACGYHPSRVKQILTGADGAG